MEEVTAWVPYDERPCKLCTDPDAELHPGDSLCQKHFDEHADDRNEWGDPIYHGIGDF